MAARTAASAPAQQRAALVRDPQGADQFENAARCERAGALVVLPPDEEVTGDAVAATRTARIAVRSPGTQRRHARLIAHEFDGDGDPEEAAAAIEKTARPSLVWPRVRTRAPCWSWPLRWRRSPLRSSPMWRRSCRRIDGASTAQAAPSLRQGVPPFDSRSRIEDDEATRTSPCRGAPRRRETAAGSGHLRALRLLRAKLEETFASWPASEDRSSSWSLYPGLARCSSTSGCPATGRASSGALTAYARGADVEPDTPWPALGRASGLSTRRTSPGLPASSSAASTTE